jgi:hypothetical protein
MVPSKEEKYTGQIWTIADVVITLNVKIIKKKDDTENDEYILPYIM